MEEFQNSVLGHTGLKVGRLGLGASYGAPPQAFEEAFERGCNYFYMGGGLRKNTMKTAIRNLCSKGLRDRLVISVQTYARMGMMTEFFIRRTLKSMGIDHADILMLGWHNTTPFSKLLEFALSMKEKGLCRFIGISGHNRPLFPLMERKTVNGEKIFDIFHIRYNPAHRGAETDCFPMFDRTSSPPGVVSYTATRWGHLLDPKRMPEGRAPLRARDCYRFALSNPQVDICLCGPKNTAQMQEALTALDAGPLETKERQHIETIGDHIHGKGGSFFF